MCFAIMACGYVPRSALDFSDSGVVRFEAILDILSECELSIHDISRVEVDELSSLPRFNMPLELGADLGLRLRGPAAHRRRRTLVLDAAPHRYDQTLSDISGMDIEAHGNRSDQIIRQVRDWLNAGHAGDRPLPGAGAIGKDYATFLALADEIVGPLRLDTPDDLHHVDYLFLVEEALARIETARTAT